MTRFRVHALSLTHPYVALLAGVLFGQAVARGRH